MNVIESRTLFRSFIHISKQHFILIIHIFSIIIKNILIDFFSFFLRTTSWIFNFKRFSSHWRHMDLFDFFLILLDNHFFNIFFLRTRLESIFSRILCFFLYWSRTWHHWQFSCSRDSTTWSSSRRWHTSRSVLWRLGSAGSSCVWSGSCLFWKFSWLCFWIVSAYKLFYWKRAIWKLFSWLFASFTPQSLHHRVSLLLIIC